MASRLNLSRRRSLIWAAGTLATPLSAWAQDPAPFPTRPLTLWVPWQAGGGTDLTLRVLADLAGHKLGQKVLVDNKGGAGGTLVMPILKQAAPDGYTLAQLPQPVFRAPHLRPVDWHPVRDTTPIIQLTGTTFGIVVAAESPLRTLDDVFEFARKRPGELTVATNGVGTTPHVVMEDLFRQRGLQFVHVPYKGVAEQTLAVASSQVTIGVGSTAFGPFVDKGQLRLLATLGDERAKRWPHAPTLKELGLGIVATSPYGLAGPAGLPKAIVTRLHDAFKAALFDPAHLAELAKYDQTPAYLDAADYTRACAQQFEAERALVERLGLANKPG